jgi:hypothetical protein
VVSFTHRPLYPRGKIPLYPLARWLSGPQNRSGRRGEEEILPLLRLELRPFGRLNRSQSLYRLRYPGSYVLRQRNEARRKSRRVMDSPNFLLDALVNVFFVAMLLLLPLAQKRCRCEHGVFMSILAVLFVKYL